MSHRPRNTLLLAAACAGLAAALSGCVGFSDAGPTATPDATAGGTWAAGRPSPRLLLTLGDPERSGLDDWPGQIQTVATPYDLDRDGVDELIAHSTDTVYVFDARSGRARATLPTTLPPAWHTDQVLNRVAAAVLAPGQAPSLVVASSAGFVAEWRVVPGDDAPGGPIPFEKRWERHVDVCRAWPGMDAGPVLADLDGDGTLEIMVQTEEVGFYALRANGTTLWKQCWGGGNASPRAADLDGDGRLEAIFASDAGFISVLNGKTGAPLWTFDAKKLGIRPAAVSVSPTVAELDGRPPLELVFTAREVRSDDPATFGDNHMGIVAVHQNRTTWRSELLWMRQPAWANPMSYTHLVAHDVDGDGETDLFGVDWNTMGHKPGDWERLGPAHAFRLTAEGEDVWVREIDAWWSNKDMALADSDGDGALDLLVNGPSGAEDGLWRLDPLTGAAEGFLSLGSWKMARGPLLLDADHDGAMELAVSVASPEQPPERGAVLLFDLGAPDEAVWRGAP